jgi:hypothetical protein
MNTRQAKLKKEALECWNAVDPATRRRLREEMERAPGMALIELDKIRPVVGYFEANCQARVIRVAFGTPLHPDCRYLSLSDIPPTP